MGTFTAVIDEATPFPLPEALRSVARCVARTAVLLARGRIRQPRTHVGQVIAFGDGSHGRVYRETVVEGAANDMPAVLVVAFRLRRVRGRGHTLFRLESELNTPLFVAFPGFVSKLWLAHDEHGVYRGVYEWNDAALAHAYARALWWVLALVSERQSIRYVVVPGVRRDDALNGDPRLTAASPEDGGWWVPVAVRSGPIHRPRRPAWLNAAARRATRRSWIDRPAATGRSRCR